MEPVDVDKLNVTVEQGAPEDLTLLEPGRNARFMTHETFMNLVANIRRDGVLTQLPFVHHDLDTGVREVLSGNHRVRAAIEVGLTVIQWLETTDPLTPAQKTAIQLSHNSINGEDDPAILASLYEQIDDVDWRAYSGLDDDDLGLIADIDVSGLSDANLDYQSLLLTFLPDDWERIISGFDEARALAQNPEAHWLVRYDDHVRLLDALEAANHLVKNQAAALSVILDVFERHKDELEAAE